MKKRIIATATVALFSMAGMVFAQPPPGGGRQAGPQDGRGRPDMSSERQMEVGAGRLGLTQEETAALKELQFDYKKEVVELESAVEQARIDVQRLLTGETVEETEVMAAIETAGAAQTALQKARVHHILRIRDIVGPEKARAMARRLTRERRGDAMDRPGQRTGRPDHPGARGGERPNKAGAGRPGRGMPPQDF